MSVAEASIKRLTNLYRLARKSRLLDTHLGQRAFSATYFLYKRYVEDPYHGLTARHPELFQGGNILDLGANIGYTATVFSRAASPEFKVYAFEPEPFNFGLLQRSARARSALQRIVPIQSAVGETDGTIELWENKHHHGDHRVLTDQFRQTATSSGVVTTPITRIDTFVAEQPGKFPVRFIKVDVQGYELPVCKGMEHTLDSNPQGIVSLEYMPSAMRDLGFEPGELFSWFQSRDYRVCRIEKHGRLRPFTGDLSSADGYCDLLFSRENLYDAPIPG